MFSKFKDFREIFRKHKTNIGFGLMRKKLIFLVICA